MSGPTIFAINMSRAGPNLSIHWSIGMHECQNARETLNSHTGYRVETNGGSFFRVIGQSQK